MPSFVTHSIFATTVQRVTVDTIAHIVESYPAAYQWGAQGPDPLRFYHTPLPSRIAALSDKLHEMDAAPLFEALCTSAIAQHSGSALAYLLGFCTHYALDRMTYMFIKAQSEQVIPLAPNFVHEARMRLVESDLDGIMIDAFISSNPTNYKAYRLLQPSAGESTVCARILAQATRNVCKKYLTPAMVYHAFHDIRRIYKLAHYSDHARQRVQRLEKLLGKSGMASSLLRPSEPLEVDCANTEGRTWIAADGSARTDTFFNLFDAAVPLAVSLQRTVLARYYHQKPLDIRLFSTNLHGQTTHLKK